MGDESLENLVEELCDQQVAEEELEKQVLEKITEMDVDELNEFSQLHRMEFKKVLEDHNYPELARQIDV